MVAPSMLDRLVLEEFSLIPNGDNEPLILFSKDISFQKDFFEIMSIFSSNIEPSEFMGFTNFHIDYFPLDFSIKINNFKVQDEIQNNFYGRMLYGAIDSFTRKLQCHSIYFDNNLDEKFWWYQGFQKKGDLWIKYLD